MDRQKIAIILIACAIALGIGSFILISKSSEDTSVHREIVTEPTQPEAEAPAWVNHGQKAEPDYSPSDAKAQNATPVPEEVQASTKVIEVTEDKMVTFTFVESMADFLLHRFQPTNENGTPATKVSAKTLNMYYGRELDGFSVQGNDIRLARQSVLDYAFTPSMLKTLYSLYSPVFMAHIVETATNDDREYTVGVQSERRSLTEAETAVMLRLNAQVIDQTASVLRAVANDPSITQLAGQYIQAAKAVGRANVQLQNAITDNKDTSTSSTRLKQAIMQREQVKRTITSRLKKACLNCPEAELFYITQWSYRRVLNNPEKKLATFGVAAEVLEEMAKQFRTTADALIQ